MPRFACPALAAILLLANGRPPLQTPDSVHISAADIRATIDGAPAGRVSDQQIRHIDAGGHNVGVGVVQRPPSPPSGRSSTTTRPRSTTSSPGGERW